ncbi:hypothetical protein TNCV_1248541 [Trichonephila clavipes]|nr:hypothetical protein TNCV_1248541 [Trichonephila clavipes]
MVLRCRVWSRIVIQQQNARFEKPRPLFPNRLFQFRQGTTVPRSIDGSNLQKVSSKITINEAIKSNLYAKPVHSVYITGYQSFDRKALAHLSKQWIPVLQRPRRSWSLLSFGSNLYPPPSKSLFFRALLSLSSPKKTPFKHQGWVHTTPLIIGRPQKSALGLPSSIRAEHTNTFLNRVECKGTSILVKHLDTFFVTPPLFHKPILLTPASASVFFLSRLHLLSTGAGSPLAIMNAGLGVGAFPRSNNKQ